MIFRQGDVLLIPAAFIPSEARAVAPENGRVILARGEATGHHHSISSATATLFRPDDMPSGNGAWLQIGTSGAVLEHQEHDSVQLPTGIYMLAVQVEETPEIVRQVID